LQFFAFSYARNDFSLAFKSKIIFGITDNYLHKLVIFRNRQTVPVQSLSDASRLLTVNNG
ncbi:MAG: hypothetical protein JXR36_15715, partial [Bacteroidales bacterium]|nr:hypothetical protein [Bacteroidales bacterium]